jgi:hypothetical protein
MKPQALKEFKERMRNLNKVLSKIIVVWDNPQYEVISVLLQNLGFDATDCQDYSHEKAVVKCENIIEALREMNDFDGHHLIKWIFEEVESSYMGYSFEEE